MTRTRATKGANRCCLHQSDTHENVRIT
jgi:hypothetical protein